MAANPWQLSKIFIREFVVDFFAGVGIAVLGSGRHTRLLLQLYDVIEARWVVEQGVARFGPTTPKQVGPRSLRSIRTTRESRLSLGRGILYVSAGSSSNASLTVKPRAVLIATRSAPQPLQSASNPPQVNRVRFYSGPPWASVRRLDPVTWHGLGRDPSSGPLRPGHAKRVEPPAERAGRLQRQLILEHGGGRPGGPVAEPAVVLGSRTSKRTGREFSFNVLRHTLKIVLPVYPSPRAKETARRPGG